MWNPKSQVLLLLVIILFPARLVGQEFETKLIRGAVDFTWPQTQASATEANRLPAATIENFLNGLRVRVPQFLPVRLGGFRFVSLEKGRYYLLTITGGERFYWYTTVVAPEGQGFRYSDTISHGALPLAMTAVDLDGDGINELVTSHWAAGYQGASTPPIYWYIVWRFRDGVPYDASAQFPEFYRGFVLAQLPHLDELLNKLRPVDEEGVRVPLAEIEHVRLKFQRAILGEKNAGLEQALAWIESKDAALQSMGIWSLAEMPASAAEEKLKELAASPRFADVAKGALDRRARLLEKGP